MPDLSEDLRGYFEAVVDDYRLDELSTAIEVRRRRRNRHRALAAVALLVVAAAGIIFAATRSPDADDRAIADAREHRVPVVVPSVTGLTLIDAQTALERLGLVADVDTDLDTDDPQATVIAQEPPPTETVPAGTVVGLRTAGPVPDPDFLCPQTRTSPDASADGLPPAGQTDLEHVRRVLDENRDAILSQFGASRAYLVHRDGRVWIPDGTSDPRIEARADYQIAVELPPAACPQSVAVFEGVPIAFVQLVRPTGASAGQVPLDTVEWSSVRYPFDCGDTQRGPVGWKVRDIAYATPAGGTALAIILVTCDAGAGTPPANLLVYDSATSRSTPHLLQTLVRSDDNWTADHIGASGDTVSLAVAGYSAERIPRCCPDVTATLIWRWSGGSYTPANAPPAHYR